MTPELIIAIEVCLKAGKAILRHDCSYAPAFVDRLDGGLSSDEAGLEAYRLIAHNLSVTGLPVIGEYSESVPYEVRSGWRQFWLVAPIQGEYESLEGTGDCTVSVALIEGHEPVLGVVYAPATDELYCGSRDSGAYRVRNASSTLARTTRLMPSSGDPRTPEPCTSRLVVSRSHLDERMLVYIEELSDQYSDIELIQQGGTLNFGMVASGEADLYPRLDATCEWDTAAGHAILKAVGKNLFDIVSGRELAYNKPDLVNPFFIAR
jgi:3'(2'), 5'-bisphosphate nucleotidase